MQNRLMIHFAVSFFLLLIGGEPAEAGDYRVRKNTDGMAFDIAINRNPPVLGDKIRIEIRDAEGHSPDLKFDQAGVLGMANAWTRF